MLLLRRRIRFLKLIITMIVILNIDFNDIVSMFSMKGNIIHNHCNALTILGPALRTGLV